MQKRRLILILVALVIAFGTAQLARSVLRKPAPKVQQAETVKTTRVLVAASDLPAGLLIQPDHLEWRDWPEGSTDGYILESAGRPREDLTGAVVRQGLHAGEPVTDTRLAKPGDRGFLAAVLNPDMRAISVPVTAITGIAGFVFPGDHVDVILSHTFTREDDPERKERKAAETVLVDVRVLAIDQRTSDQEKKPETAKIVTLEVTPKQAEMLPLVVELGQLSLSLRSLARQDVVAGGSVTDRITGGTGPTLFNQTYPTVPRPRTFTWDSDVSAVLPKPTDKDALVRKVQVLRGTEAGQVVFPRDAH